MRWISHNLFVGFGTALLSWMLALAPSPKTLTLQNAVAQGLVRIEKTSGTSSAGSDYAQPMVFATLVNTADTPLALTLPLGSQLQSNEANPPMVALDFAQSPLEIAPQTSAPIGIVAFSTRVALHPTQANTYTLGEVTNNQQLITLLQAIKDEGGFIGSNLVQQRAIWQAATGADCAATDQAILDVFSVSLGCQGEAAQHVAALLARSQAATQPPNTSEVSPTPLTPTVIGQRPGGGESSTLLAVFGTIILLVGLGIAILFLAHLRKPKPDPTAVSANSEASPPGNARSTDEGSTWRPGRSPGPTIPNDPEAPSVKPRRNNSKTQPMGGSSQGTPPAPSVAEVSPNGGADVLQVTPAQPTQAQPRPARRAAITMGFDQPTLPESLRVPSLMLTGLTKSTGEPTKVLPFTMLTRSHVQQSEIQTPDATISSPHCMIRFEENQGCWTISDLSSLNGTLVDGVHASRRSTALSGAAIIQLGDVKFRFQGDGQGNAATLTQIEPSLQPQPEYRFAPNDHPYWLLTAKRLRTLEVANAAVSVPHALISFDDGWMVRDLNSSGGSRLIRAATGEQQTLGPVPQRILPDDQLDLGKQVNCRVQAPALPTVGAYQPLGWLGQGGAASVFLAHRTDDPARVPLALKLLTVTTDRAREAFTREAELLAELKRERGDHILVLHEALLDVQPAPHLVVDYIEGATLRTVLRARTSQRLTQGEILAVALAISTALAALHQRGWIHGDVKPENVLLSQRGEVFLADFGSITRIQGQPATATSAYAPPEFRTPPYGPATVAVDIYSLGAVLYELLTGLRYHHPQAAESHRQVYNQAITAPLAASTRTQTASPADDSLLGTIIERCLQPLPNRIQQMDTLHTALTQAQQALPTAHVDLGALVKSL